MTPNRSSQELYVHPGWIATGVIVHAILLLALGIYLIDVVPNYARTYYEAAAGSLAWPTRIMLFVSMLLCRFGWLLAIFVVPGLMAGDAILLWILDRRSLRGHAWALWMAVTLTLLLIGGLSVWAIRLPLG